MRVNKAVSGLVFILVAVANSAVADVTFSYSCESSEGTPVDVSFTFDEENATDSSNPPTVGNYSFTSPTASVTVGSNTYTSTSSSGSGTLDIEVLNNFSMADEFNVDLDFSIVQVDLRLRDTTTMAFMNIDLPTAQPSASSFATARTLTVLESSSETLAQTTCSLTAVPEPSSLSCLLMVFVGTAWLRWSRKLGFSCV